MREITVSCFQMTVKTMLLSKFGIDETFFAHTLDSSPSETLSAHLNLTMSYYEKIVADKKLQTLIDSLIHQMDSKNFALIKEMFVNTIYLHDLGKKNPCFQARKMNNPLFEKYKDCGDSKHSQSGAIEFIEYYMSQFELLDDETYFRMVYILYNFSYHISKHHGSLDSIENYLANKAKEHHSFANVKKNIDLYLDKKFEFYILNKLLFSLLVSCDYYATSEYMADFPIDDFGVFSKEDKERLDKKFQEYLSQFQNPSGINILRNEMFEEAQKNLLNHKEKNIFYLEAPTGSGKTITSINLALQLLESNDALNKLFYIFPFNTLVEQTKNVFDDIFQNSLKIEVINSITPIIIDEAKQEDEETKYQKSYINRLFFHSPAIITTHEALFNILFGTSKEDNFPLWQLANSVIILDEIQSYNNHLWWYMVEFFDKYASLLNIKIIIMSATLPKLDFFLDKKENFVSLISDEKREYLFKNDFFKNRVKMNFSLLDEKMKIERLVEILKAQPKDKKILFEFIKKQSAREFYNAIKDDFDNVCELSGDDNKAYRQHVIDKSKNENLIIVATQVIEAGVDIDMDIGFKDISTIDGEEQFMGRINRSCKKEGIVYFFDLDDVEKIYRGDHRLGFDLTNPKYRKILEDKEFDSYYEEVLKSIENQGNRFENGLLTNYGHFEELVKKLNYKEISKTMTLINSQNFTLYFPFQIDLSLYKGVKEFENIDESFITNAKLDGQKVWDEFIGLHRIENFVEKKVKNININALMQFFTFSLFKYFEGQRPYIGEDMYGYYFVENYEDFITKEGKFDREKYNAIKNSNFL